MTHPTCPRSGLLRRCLLALFTLTFSVALSAAEDLVRFEVEAGDAGDTLKQFASQAGREILFPVGAVAAVKTNAVQGEYSVREGLARLLTGTRLEAKEDAETGALVVNLAELPNAPGAVAATRQRPERVPTRVAEDGTIELEEFAVTGTRLRANTGERPMQPVLTLTSLDIERTGAANLGQLFQYIPAITSFSTGLNAERATGTLTGGTGTGQTQSRTSAQLRDGSQTETLLLIDGRRVPLTALRNAGGNGYDLGVIPLAAIERIEVLLDGASAIYGADAVNGVINIILKKRYTGTEVRFNYDNTFDTDAAVSTVTLTHGFARGGWSGLLTLSASENNILLYRDRRLSSTFDRREFGGITDQSSPTLFVEGAGSLAAASGLLPGAGTARVSIPTNFAGGSITVADYVAAPAPVGGLTPDRHAHMSYTKDRSAYLRLGYEFNERLTLTAAARFGRREFRDNGFFRRVENVTIPAGFAGNPFGVPVRLSKTFYDLPPIVSGSETEQDDLSFTAAGKLFGDWRYEAGFSYVLGVSNMITPDLPGAGGQIGSQVAPAAQFASRLNAEIAAGRSPVLIYDSRTQSPNAPGALDVFWVSTQQTRLSDRVRTLTYSAQADGELFTLPAGEVRAVVGGEARVERVAFPGAIGGQVWPVIPARDVLSFYAEVRVPVVGPKQEWPLLHTLDLNLAARTEDYSDFGRATTPRYGVGWRPFRSLLVRASYGEGFLAPQLYRTAQESAIVALPPTFIPILFGNDVDFSRGNSPITGPLEQISGGNPNLKPQLSENRTAGVVLDIPYVAGLSISYDYYDTRYTDGFGVIANMTDRQLYAPETIFRGPNLPSDPAGWLGPIIGYDGRTINIASARSAGYSLALRYQRSTSWGDFKASLASEKTLSREEKILPNSAPTASVAKRFSPMRATLMTSWSRGPWDAGINGIYGGKVWSNSSNQALAPSRYTAAVTRWDVNAGYDFGRRKDFGAKGDQWWKRALHDSKLRVTIINVFDTEPPLNVNGFYSSSVIDPRLRRYVIDVTKRF
jgi:iron complex outermembrane recepter protein